MVFLGEEKAIGVAITDFGESSTCVKQPQLPVIERGYYAYKIEKFLIKVY
jgi:hypothetical protein